VGEFQVDGWQVKFSGHAIRRMFERSITKADVVDVIRSGEVIEDYPNDTPFPSCLLLGWIERRPLHVVIGKDEKTGTIHAITVYHPNPLLWSSDFRTRR